MPPISELSGIRLIRALSSHLLLGAALVVAVYSFDFGEGIYAEVGAPSRSYLLVGGLMAAASAIMCLAAHADYVGLSPAMLRAARQVRRRLRRAGSEIGGIAIDSLVRLASGSKTVQTAPVHVLAAHRSRSTR